MVPCGISIKIRITDLQAQSSGFVMFLNNFHGWQLEGYLRRLNFLLLRALPRSRTIVNIYYPRKRNHLMRSCSQEHRIETYGFICAWCISAPTHMCAHIRYVSTNESGRYRYRASAALRQKLFLRACTPRTIRTCILVAFVCQLRYAIGGYAIFCIRSVKSINFINI